MADLTDTMNLTGIDAMDPGIHTPQMTEVEGGVAGAPPTYGTILGGGKRKKRKKRSKKTNRKKRSTKKMRKRGKRSKRSKRCACQICDCNPCSCSKKNSKKHSKKRKTLAGLRASMK